MSKLVIVESPAKAHTIEKFLGKGYSVCASNGHVRDLPKSRLGVDIENDFEPKYITIRGKSDVVEKLKQSAKSAEKIYFATDPDREGEAISWHLASLLKIPPEDACRVEFNEITKDAVTNALKSPRKLNMYLVNAQQARRVLDRLVGYKISPILWVKVKKGLSAGRVQSVATRLVVDREREIENFIPKEYWLISASLKDSNRAFEAKFFGKAGKKLELGTEAETLEIVNALKNAEYKVVKAVYGSKKRHAPPPFTTSMMQQEASWRLGFTTKKTAMIAQKLYEGVDVKGEGMVGLITYMRTDSVRVSAEAQKSAQEFIRNNFGAEFVPEKPNVYKSSKSSQDAHEAIRPTSVFRTPESIKGSLSPDHYKLYKLIYDRFLASQMSEAVYKTLNAEIEAYEYLFKYSGSTLEFKGYLRAYKEDDTEDQTEKLPELAEGKTVKLVKLNHEQKFTEPPSRFTEGTLVRELEDKGIGRPSTYAPTISTIIDRGYVVREGKLLKPTELGFLVTDLMCEHFADIVNISFTADMENQLDEIEEGRAQWKSVVAEFYQPFSESVEKARHLIEKVKIPDKVSDIPCDKCGAMIVYKTGRYGTFLACPEFPKCRNTKAIAKELDAPCPKCGAPLIQRKSKKGKTFYGCSRYPECDFASNFKPVGEKCPECGGYLVASKWGVICADKNCGYKRNGKKKNEN